LLDSLLQEVRLVIMKYFWWGFLLAVLHTDLGSSKNKMYLGSFKNKMYLVEVKDSDSAPTPQLSPGISMRRNFVQNEFLSNQSGGQCSCGRNGGGLGAENQNRILGGQLSESHGFPWMARIYGGCVGTLCGGALISNRHILTAYHCIRKKRFQKPCDHSDGQRKAVLGTDYVPTSAILTGTAGISLSNFVHPPRADLTKDDPLSHDIAIYILDTPVTFSSNIQPICLPNPQDTYEGKPAVVAGWGDYRRGKNPNSERLRKVDQKVHGVVSGHSTLISTSAEEDSDGTPMDPCSGDSGGPLMWRDSEGRFRIIGTVSGGGFNCDRNIQVSNYHGDNRQKYGNVNMFVSWIKGVLNKERDTDLCAIVD